MRSEFHHATFLRPREALHELLALDAAANGLCNSDNDRVEAAYRNELKAKGLLSRGPQGQRLTADGRRRLHYLLVDYIHELMELQEAARRLMLRALVPLATSGCRTVAFYPYGDTAEAAFSALKRAGLRLVAVVDDDPRHWGRRFHGIRVGTPRMLVKARPQAVVVTTCLFEPQILARLKEMRLGKMRIHTLFSPGVVGA